MLADSIDTGISNARQLIGHDHKEGGQGLIRVLNEIYSEF
jgi:hypothetical protein